MPVSRMLATFFMAAWLVAASQADTESALAAEVKEHPESFDANVRIGEFYAAAGKYRLALPYLEKARAMNPKSYGTAYDLALDYLKAGDSGRAETLIRQLISETDKPELHNLLGSVLETEGKPDEAVRELERAARADPSERNVFDLADELLAHGAYQPALQIFQYGSAKFPRSSRLKVGEGVAHYSLGQYNEAVESLCTAVDLDPRDAKALAFLGKMYDISPAMGDEVTKRLAHFADLYPGSAQANYYYALSLWKRALRPGAPRDEAKIERLLKKSIQLDPSFADARYQLGLFYEDHDRAAEAIAQYQAAIALRSDLTAAHYRLARLYAKLGSSERAEQEFAIVRQLKSGSPGSGAK